jgi:predicted dehydrogenase
MNRNIFLKNSLAAVAGSFIASSIIPSHVIGKNAPSDKINIGLIGCGRIARSHNLPELLKYNTARVVAVCDLDSKRLANGKMFIENYYTKAKGSANFLDVKMYGDYREMLKNPEIDAVLICTPITGMHSLL